VTESVVVEEVEVASMDDWVTESVVEVEVASMGDWLVESVGADPSELLTKVIKVVKGVSVGDGSGVGEVCIAAEELVDGTVCGS
jgi:hypothetical protein